MPSTVTPAWITTEAPPGAPWWCTFGTRRSAAVAVSVTGLLTPIAMSAVVACAVSGAWLSAVVALVVAVLASANLVTAVLSLRWWEAHATVPGVGAESAVPEPTPAIRRVVAASEELQGIRAGSALRALGAVPAPMVEVGGAPAFGRPDPPHAGGTDTSMVDTPERPDVGRTPALGPDPEREAGPRPVVAAADLGGTPEPARTSTSDAAVVDETATTDETPSERIDPPPASVPPRARAVRRPGRTDDRKDPGKKVGNKKPDAGWRRVAGDPARRRRD